MKYIPIGDVAAAIMTVIGMFIGIIPLYLGFIILLAASDFKIMLNR